MNQKRRKLGHVARDSIDKDLLTGIFVGAETEFLPIENPKGVMDVVLSYTFRCAGFFPAVFN
jgi:hypothetical protein